MYVPGGFGRLCSLPCCTLLFLETRQDDKLIEERKPQEKQSGDVIHGRVNLRTKKSYKLRQYKSVVGCTEHNPARTLYVLSEVYYLHEVCQPAIIHTTTLYSKCARAQRAWLQVLLPLPGLPWSIMGQAFPCETSSWRTRHNLKLDAGEPSVVGWMRKRYGAHARYSSLTWLAGKSPRLDMVKYFVLNLFLKWAQGETDWLLPRLAKCLIKDNYNDHFVWSPWCLLVIAVLHCTCLYL